MPIGLFLYFMPPDISAILGARPLWLVRVGGGIIFAWGLFHMLGSAGVSRYQVAALVAGNLLTAATLFPAVWQQGASMPSLLRAILLGVAFALGLMGVVALILGSTLLVNTPKEPKA